MKRRSLLMKSLLLATLFSPVLAQQNGNVTVVSDSRWNVFRPNPSPTPPMFLGLAQNVCLSATNPSMCSTGVTPAPTLYNYYGPGWAANLSSLPTGARWIWAPNTTGASTPAALQEFTFETDFYVCDAPVRGTLSVAADDFAEVSINGTVLPNLTSSSHGQFTTASVPATLIRGSSILLGARANQIRVKARNDPGCALDNYQCNPAGVVLGGTFEFTGTGECNGFNGGTFKTGAAETLASCPAGQTGPGVTHVCVCGNWLPNTTSCVTAPPQCTGNSGQLFDVNAVETQSCPIGQVASPSSHTCLSNGTWDVPLGSCMAPQPPVTCSGATGPLPVGAVETLACPTGQVASPPQRHTCMANGQWGPTTGGICTLPTLDPGAMCAQDRGTILLGNCPIGTTCHSRVGPTPARPAWCVAYMAAKLITLWIFMPTPDACAPKPLQSTDWYCDP